VREKERERERERERRGKGIRKKGRAKYINILIFDK